MRPEPVARSLSELTAQFARISQHVREHFAGADDALLRKRPAAGGWNAAECFAHLNLSVDPYFATWEQVLPNCPPADSETYTLDFWGRILVWLVEPPARLRVPAPATFQPMEIERPQQTVEEFLDRQQAILRVIEKSAGRAIDKTKLVSPFNARMRYSVWSSLCVTASHERRHLWQAGRAAGIEG
ncbi:MAG: hypothetical protein RL328_708 [Acidobacteriota bacterium]|jgi:hypothetical protein